MTLLLLPYLLKINNACKNEHLVNPVVPIEPIRNLKCTKSIDQSTGNYLKLVEMSDTRGSITGLNTHSSNYLTF